MPTTVYYALFYITSFLTFSFLTEYSDPRVMFCRSVELLDLNIPESLTSTCQVLVQKLTQRSKVIAVMTMYLTNDMGRLRSSGQ